MTEAANMKKKPVIVLNDWAIVTNDDGQLPATSVRYYLVGTVERHPDPSVTPGDEIRSRRLLRLNAQRRVAETKNCKFKLKTPSEEYIKFLEGNDREVDKVQILAGISKEHIH